MCIRVRYDTGVTPEYGTQLLTLSTCGDTRPDTDARFAILAMREMCIRDRACTEPPNW